MLITLKRDVAASICGGERAGPVAAASVRQRTSFLIMLRGPLHRYVDKCRDDQSGSRNLGGFGGDVTNLTQNKGSNDRQNAQNPSHLHDFRCNKTDRLSRLRSKDPHALLIRITGYIFILSDIIYRSNYDPILALLPGARHGALISIKKGRPWPVPLLVVFA